MKRIISVFISLCIAFVLAGCGGSAIYSSATTIPLATSTAKASTTAAVTTKTAAVTTTTAAATTTTVAVTTVKPTAAVTTKTATSPATTTKATTKITTAGGSGNYVLNTSSMKFHKPSCGSVAKISTANREDVTLSRAEIISRGYSPCGNCHP